MTNEKGWNSSGKPYKLHRFRGMKPCAMIINTLFNEALMGKAEVFNVYICI
jgi:hypothetical protein